jgi:hypothetical protein
MATTPEAIDYVKWMRIFAQTSPEDFKDRLGSEWVQEMCLTAADRAFAECPSARYRYANGALSERLFASVVCGMVLRVARWRRIKTESNGAYVHTDYEPHQVSPGYESSPDLFITSKEKSVLEGDAGGGPMGTIYMDVERLWGR